MKVVYNTCYGGFSLSPEAITRYAELKGVDASELGSGRDFNRADPILVQVVEELGTKANGPFASLEIAEVAAGERWRIDEYDGNESVMTIDDYDWQVAT